MLKLVEGRYPNIFVAAPVAILTNNRAEYIRNRPFDDAYYKKLNVDYIKKFRSASRENIDHLLYDKWFYSVVKDQIISQLAKCVTRYKFIALSLLTTHQSLYSFSLALMPVPLFVFR